MTNKILHTISNRSVFQSLAFPRVTDFHPSELPTDVEHLRQLMGLNVTVHDYNLVGVLRAADTFPDLRQEFGENVRNYTLRDFRLPPVAVSGAELGPDGNGLPRVMRFVQQWPADYAISVTYLADNAARISDGPNTEVATIFRNIDGDISLSWPAWTGVRGTLTSVAAWTSGTVISVPAFPASFPYKALAQALQDDGIAYDLRIATGLQGAFFSARSALEKVAVSALVLSRSHPQFHA